MAQAKITNHTDFCYETLFANDEQFRPLITPIIKATYNILLDGELSFSKQPLPVNLAGEYRGDPEFSSYLYEPECAFIKPSTDVVVLGNAVSTQGPVRHLLVDMQVANLRKRIHVLGDRQWLKKRGRYLISDITPFEQMPLSYENAFGGLDCRGNNPDKQGFEPRNTVGKGFYQKKIKPDDNPMWLPNLENPDALIRKISDRPAPVGCGFTLPHWQPRAVLAGTYDEQWQKNLSPLLPKDFDRRFFNAASEGLISDNYLKGDEAVRITNMTTTGELNMCLPAAPSPVCNIELQDVEFELPTFLDTVIINTCKMQLQLIWRNYVLLEKGPHDVEAINIYYG